jgi:hypothetical protein
MDEVQRSSIRSCARREPFIVLMTKVAPIAAPPTIRQSFLFGESGGVRRENCHGGPLPGDDGPIGSLFVVEAPNAATVLKFHEGDPFFTAGVWRQTAVNAYKAWRA